MTKNELERKLNHFNKPCEVPSLHGSYYISGIDLAQDIRSKPLTSYLCCSSPSSLSRVQKQSLSLPN